MLLKNLSFKKEYLVLLVFALLIAILYGNTLKNGFIYDDFQQVVENKYIQSWQYLPKVVTGCMWEYAFGGCKDRAIYYRPIHSLSYFLTYQVSPKAGFFHFVNLIYFFLVVSLVFFLAKTLSNNFLFSFAAALIFLIHPINSETVNWIAAVPELSLAIFILLSVIFYLKYRETASFKKFLIAGVFYFLALLAKEPAIFLPLVFLFIDWRLFKRKLEDLLDWQEMKNYLILAGLTLIYFLMRFAVLGNFISQGKSPYAPFSLGDRVYAFFHLFGRYLKKFFFPQPLIFFAFFDERSNFFSPSFFLSFLAAAVFFVAFFFAFRKNKNILLFAFAWLFVFLLPVLIFIEATGESVFSERYSFVPNIGFALAIAYLFTFLWKKGKKVRLALIFLLIIYAGISGKIILARNRDWVDKKTMYLKTLIQNPEATPIRFNYAVYLRNEEKDFEKAKVQFEEILRRKPNWADISMIYLHLGDYYFEKGEEEKALDYYHKSATASQDWKTHFAYNRLGIFYAKKENYLMALTYFCQAFQANPDSFEGKANLDRAASLIETQSGIEKKPGAEKNKKEKPVPLYEQIKNTFAKGEEKIKFIEKQCQNETCAFLFFPRLGENDVILPFLISAKTGEKETIKIENPVFDQKTNQIVLTVPAKYEEKPLDFIFPTCERVYYEVNIAVKEK